MGTGLSVALFVGAAALALLALVRALRRRGMGWDEVALLGVAAVAALLGYAGWPAAAPERARAASQAAAVLLGSLLIARAVRRWRRRGP